MAHKIKAKLTFPQQQENKTRHYTIMQKTIDSLKEERKKENTLNEQLNHFENQLRGTQETINYITKHPDRYIHRRQINGYNLSYKGDEALEVVKQDKQQMMRDIEAIKTQRRVNVERQMEIEKALRNYPTFKERLEKYEKTGQWKW